MIPIPQDAFEWIAQKVWDLFMSSDERRSIDDAIAELEVFFRQQQEQIVLLKRLMVVSFAFIAGLIITVIFLTVRH